MDDVLLCCLLPAACCLLPAPGDPEVGGYVRQAGGTVSDP
jgi:hypothetical protein